MEQVDLYDAAGKHFRQVRSLVANEYEQYRNAVQCLREFRRWGMLERMFNRNAKEFHDALSSATAILVNSTFLSDARDEIDFVANHSLLNFMSSMRLFLDHTATRLKRRYGADGSPVQAFKARTAASYDNVFGYRFLYRLRNYGQHCSVPIGHVQVESRLVDLNDHVQGRTAALAFDVHELLLQGSDVWGANLKSELETLPQLLNVSPLVEDARQQLAELCAVVKDSEKPELCKAVQPIINISEPVLDSGGVPIVGVLIVDGPQIEFVHLPYDTLEWLGYALPRLTI